MSDLEDALLRATKVKGVRAINIFYVADTKKFSVNVGAGNGRIYKAVSDEDPTVALEKALKKFNNEADFI